ncbi:MAG: AAA-like domain-containing protein [Deltaproteobacteria bacterium]|nr:AAA-like domain-containing protein [Deltaproteobacteria bacterium]
MRKLNPQRDVVKWLHLSDLHFYPERRWQWTSLKSHLFKDLKHLHAKSGPWDLVFFTGDLSKSGDTAQLTAVDAVLDDLWGLFSELQPGSEPKLLAVPGNHDLERPAALQSSGVDYLEGYDLEAATSRDTSAAGQLINHINAAFTNYSNWWQECRYRPDDAVLSRGLFPGDFTASFNIRDIRLGVVGLNSSLLQLTGGNYEGKLVVHPNQFYCACPNEDGPEWAKEHDVCLLLTHHPTSWLNLTARDWFEGCITDQGRFPLHLYGHQHEVDTKVTARAGLSFKGEWQSSALMGEEEIEIDGEKINRPSFGYAVGELQCTNGQTQIRFWPRTATRPGRGPYNMGAGEWRFGPSIDRVALTDDVSEWQPVGPYRGGPAVAPPNVSANPIGCWFDVTVGNSHNTGLRPQDERLAKIKSNQNPYFAGASLPANSPVFVGRQRLMRNARECLLADPKPLSVNLFGERRMGKTSILNQLTESLATNPEVVVLRTSVQSWDDDVGPQRFYGQLYRAICKALSLSQDEQTSVDFNAVKGLLRAHSRDHRFIVVIDEFDILLHYPAFQKEFYWNLRSLADDGQTRLGYLVSSRQSLPYMGEIHADINGSAYWNVFPEIKVVAQLTEDDVTVLANAIWAKSTATHLPDVAMLSHIAGNHPAFVQMTLRSLWSAARDNIALADSDMKRRLKDYFKSLWGYRTEKEKTLLRNICHGNDCQPDTLQFDELQQRGIIDETGALFSVAFAEWMMQHSGDAS